MNRKLVNGLLLLTLASGGCGMFTSCKDTDDDFQSQVIGGQYDLKQRVDALENYTDDLKGNVIPEMERNIGDNKEAIDNIKDKLLPDLNTELGKLKDQLANTSSSNQTEIANLNTQIGNLNNDIATLTTDLANLTTENAGLKGDLDALKTTVATLEARLADYKPGVTEEEMNAAIDAAIQGLQTILQQQIDTCVGDINSIKATLGTVATDISNLQSEVANKADKSVVDAIKNDLDAAKTDIQNIQTEITSVQTNIATLTTDLDQVKTDLATTVANVATNAAKLEALKTDQEALKADLDAHKIKYDELAENVALLSSDFGELYTQINGKGGIAQNVMTLMEKVAANEADIDNLYELIRTNQQAITDLQNLTAKYFNNIDEVLNRRVTSLLFNQAWNPIFGSINLPVGLNTSIAANYYGYSDHNLNFPLSIDAAGYDVLHENSGINKIGQQAIDKLLGSLKGEQVVISSEKVYMQDGNNNLGQLYINVNPTHIDTKNIDFKLVSSDGKEAPIDVEVVPTDEKLTFGLTRSADNGFYRANLHVSETNAPEIGIRIEPGLKTAMKDALTSHTKSDFAQLAKVIVGQMQDILPAYGIKATWEEPGTEFPNAAESKTRTYISKYEIAATAFRPLGYHFLEGEGASKDLLPTVGSLKDAFNKAFDEIANKININIKFNDIKDLDISGLNVKIDIKDVTFDAAKIEIDLGGIEVEGEKTVGFNPDGSAITEWGIIGTTPSDQKITLTYEPDGTVDLKNGVGALNEFVGDMQKKINEMLKDINTQVNDELIKQVNDLVENQIKGQVNNMLADINSQLQGINGQIDSQVKNILADIKNTLLGKLGRVDNLVDKYNDLANRVNKFLKDPNHYLQVTMAYSTGNGNLGELSSDINYPTHFKMAGGNAVALYATSYTAELIAPSYKKYVAVSRVWAPKAAESNVDWSLAEKANQTEFLNEVRPGVQQRFILDTNNLEKGYKYEVIYSSLDYQGYTSTRTFYFVVD